ncbi:hypothetical protein OJ996_25135 [Luteolibacter sp. GHJ8]|uniref:HEAT repeat protein n=1 Tax=Luteolibacter rhizosphaerae TaxID=2989719 RepID=A0ABT3GAM5_9BACT|nr:hypothetical protein [Luteolibacter rhizosphaerae]MCW1916898.1 hypothetical protein [Luteolibacter rhizosphaerae]
MSSPAAAAPAAGGAISSAPTAADGAASSSPGAKVKPMSHMAGSALKSKDTLESIKTAEGPDLYSRVALWMVDASEEDLKGFWDHYRQKENRENDINDLIFINWTRINPQGAIAAAKGTPDEHYAWWAWACHDPETALATAKASNPDRVNNVTWGIGEFHPDWLLEHFEELPENSRNNALQGLVKWDDRADPEKILNFLLENDRGLHPGLFKVLAMRDPWTALEWLQEKKPQGRLYSYADGRDPMGMLLDTVSKQDPEVFKRMIDQTPSGELKRQMETVLFNQQLESDPEAAVAALKDIKAPLVLTERYSKAAMHYLASDPDRAFELARQMLDECPTAMNLNMRVELGNGGSTTWGSGGSRELQNLMAALMAKDPERTVTLHLPAEGASYAESSTFYNLTGQWAENDIDGLVNWVNKQPESDVRDRAINAIVNKSIQEQDYESAMEWAQSSAKPNTAIHNVVANWASRDPEGVRAWMDSAELSEKLAKDLQQYIPKQNP